MRAERMRKEKEMAAAHLTIKRGLSNRAIYNLARESRHDYDSAFYWCNRVGRNAIRHCLTNYEELHAQLPFAPEGAVYNTLRVRVDLLVDETYPQFAEGQPEVRLGRIRDRGGKKKPIPAPPPGPLNTSMAAALSAALKRVS